MTRAIVHSVIFTAAAAAAAACSLPAAFLAWCFLLGLPLPNGLSSVGPRNVALMLILCAVIVGLWAMIASRRLAEIASSPTRRLTDHYGRCALVGILSGASGAVLTAMLLPLLWRVRTHPHPLAAELLMGGFAPIGIFWGLLGGIPMWFRRALGAWVGEPRPGCGLCPACGYDLRASLGRCPECGA